jgi:hypothetical protein
MCELRIKGLGLRMTEDDMGLHCMSRVRTSASEL